jgi:hypothetical protein
MELGEGFAPPMVFRRRITSAVLSASKRTQRLFLIFKERAFDYEREVVHEGEVPSVVRSVNVVKK